MTARFRDDNTEGYSALQLAELNRRYNERIGACDASETFRTGSDPHFFGKKSFADHVAEQVLAEFVGA